MMTTPQIAVLKSRGADAPAAASDRLSIFLARLRRMSCAERIWASRYEFSLWEINVWTAHYADEVPRVNGEFEWIAATLADNE